jgi:hypothetical protein
MYGLNTGIIVGLCVLALIAFVAALLRLLGKSRPGSAGMSAYEAVPEFLSPAERSFFGVLQQAVASEYQIFAKVRLADVVRPVRNSSRSGWQSSFNRISGKHVDFVLCDPARLRVVAVIELDDRSHERFERGVRDSLVDSALKNGGIPVLRISARRSYSPAQIQEEVHRLFHPPVVQPNQHSA